MDQEQTAMGEAARPLVSVVIPTLNRRDYLRIALDCAVNQTLRDIEIIVQDNASEADPADVVASFGDSRIRYFRNATTVNQTANVVTACTRARGKYLAILGDDDMWHPEFLATLVAPLEHDDTIIVSFCDHGIIGPSGRQDQATSDKVTRRWQRHLLREGRYRPFDEIALVYRSICVFSGAVLRRADFKWETIPLDTRFGLDIYLAYLAARTGKACYYVARRLAHYRYHPTALGSSLVRPDQRLANARDSMFYWREFLRDGTLAKNKRYFEMKLGLNALVVVASLLRCGDWRQAAAQLGRYWHEGLIRPRIFIYHLIYVARLHRASA